MLKEEKQIRKVVREELDKIINMLNELHISYSNFEDRFQDGVKDILDLKSELKVMKKLLINGKDITINFGNKNEIYSVWEINPIKYEIKGVNFENYRKDNKVDLISLDKNKLIKGFIYYW